MTIDEIRSALHSRALEVCRHLLPAGRLNGDEYEIGNLTGEPGRSLKININGKAGVWKDFATDDGGDNLLELWRRVRGHNDIRETMREAASWLGSPVLHPREQTRARDDIPCDAPAGHARWKSKPAGRWLYRDANGEPWLIAYRYNTKDDKAFFVYDYKARSWIEKNGHKLPDRRPLYRLDVITQRKPGEIILVEGEKCAEALRGLGFLATTTLGGCGQIHKADFSPLSNWTVRVWADADDAGRKYAETAATMLQAVGATPLIVRIPEGKAHGWDVADAVSEGWTVEEIRGQLDVAEPIEMDATEAIEDDGDNQTAAGTVAIEHLTDVGNARRFALQHAGNVIYAERLGGWHVWDGRRFRRDETGEIIRLAQQTSARIWQEVTLGRDADERKRIAQHAHRSESEARLRAMISLSEADAQIATSADAFDLDPFLLNVMNGTIDLRTSTLHRHRKADRITKLAPVVYDPRASCPRFELFLERILPSLALRRFLQRAVGYSLTADTREQVLFLLWGTGANGKSTLLEILRATLGDYARQADFATFLARKDDTVRNDLARLVGARFVAAIEVESGRRLAEAAVKQLTGGDTIVARFLYREHFEFQPVFKLWLAVNHKPRIRGTDHAIWRRIRLVPFTVTISDEEQDKDLLAKLRAELPGVLRWLVDGCLAWQEHGLGEPEEVRTATAAYREESDVLATFLAECCEIEAEAWTRASELYRAYGRWCDESGERPESQRSFGMQLSERGFCRDRDRRSGLGIWRGIRLRTAQAERTE
jgi:putative DNA primase/helicase